MYVKEVLIQNVRSIKRFRMDFDPDALGW